jgi:hypothetical protein
VKQIVKAEYRGWLIEIRCVADQDAAGDAPRAQRYTASAHAELIEQSKSGDIWIDARAQVITLGNRHFPTAEECIGVLLADVKELIDALKT